MVHIWRLGVLYHSSGRFFVIGIVPLINRWSLTFQKPKLGIVTIAFLPTLNSSLITISGFKNACSVWLKITKSKEPSGNCNRSFSASPSITVSPFDKHFWTLSFEISIPLMSISLLYLSYSINMPSPQPTSKTLVFFSIRSEIILNSCFIFNF